MSVWLEVGRIGRAHGIRGDVLVVLSTERTERLAPGSRLRTREAPLVVVSARRHQSRWIVHFEGIADRAAAEALSGRALEAEALDDDAGELWVHTVVGAEVVTVDGRRCGAVVAVHDNPAHDLFELADATLIPAVFVVENRDTPEGLVLVIDPPEGLLPDVEPAPSVVDEGPR